MAHAGSGSAFPAKSGGLKFSDVVRERFRGPAFGQDFTTWLNDVYLGFESAHVPESSQATHLVAFLESPVREIANAYLKQWKEDNQPPAAAPRAAAADRDNSMRDYYKNMLQALVAHRGSCATGLGASCAGGGNCTRCYESWFLWRVSSD